MMMIAGSLVRVAKLSSLMASMTQKRKRLKMMRKRKCSLNASLSLIPHNKRSRLHNLNSNLRRKVDLPVKEM
jgi:hypothetical protein